MSYLCLSSAHLPNFPQKSSRSSTSVPQRHRRPASFSSALGRSSLKLCIPRHLSNHTLVQVSQRAFASLCELLAPLWGVCSVKQPIYGTSQSSTPYETLCSVYCIDLIFFFLIFKTETLLSSNMIHVVVLWTQSCVITASTAVLFASTQKSAVLAASCSPWLPTTPGYH